MNVKIAILMVFMCLGKLVSMDLPDTISLESKDKQEFVISKDIFSISGTLLDMLNFAPQGKTHFRFPELHSVELEEMLRLMAQIASLRQKDSKITFQKAIDKLAFLSKKTPEELCKLISIANFLDIDSLQELIAYFIAQQLDPKLSTNDLNEIINGLMIPSSENAIKYIKRELKRFSKNPLQRSDMLLCIDPKKRQEIDEEVLDEGDFSWRKLGLEVQQQMLEAYLLSQDDPTAIAKQLLERIRTLTFGELPSEVKEHIFLFSVMPDESVFKRFKQLAVLSQINHQARTLLQTHCESNKATIAEHLIKSNKQKADEILLKLCGSEHPDIDVVKALIAFGSDINIRDESEKTLLMLASINGH